MTVTEPVVPSDGGLDSTTPTPTPDPADQAFLDLVDRLTPYLTDFAMAAAAAAVENTPVPTFRPALVQGADPLNRTVSVLIDGDTAAVTAQVLTELPYVGARVMVMFAPPASIFVVGFVTQCGEAPGVVKAYAGPLTAQAGAAGTGPTPGTPPPGYLACIGGNVSRTTYSALFAAIGTTYGSGDGAQTFGLPDYRGRGLFGLDAMAGSSDAGRLSMANTLGGTGGAETVTLSSGNLPSHNHDLGSHTHSFTPSGSVSLSGLSTDSQGNHNHNISTNAHTLTGSGGVPVWDGANGTMGFFFAPSGWTGASPSADYQGSHTHTVSGSGSFSGSGGTTGAVFANTGSTGSSTAFTTLPPYALVNWIIKT